jgi:hypothetical protein
MVNLVISLVTVIVGIVGVYWKLVLKIQALRIQFNTLKEEFDEHKKQTPICLKNFEDMNKSIALLQTEERIKEQYQTQIIKDLLAPMIKDITATLSEYVDIKTGVITREVEYLKTENVEFKKDIKELFIDFKEHTEKMIDRLVDKKSKS